MHIRPATVADADALWSLLEPIVRQGESFSVPRDMGREAALAWWCAPGYEVFVAEAGARVIGSYYIRANQLGPGSHVANCGYMTAQAESGKGVARSLCFASLARARERGFRAVQFNFVVSTNERAVRLWQHCGFQIVGRIPDGFLHPTRGYVEVYVMHRQL